MVNVLNYKKLRESLRRNWFLIGVFISILLAEIFPKLGATGGILKPEWTVKYGAVGIIFFISGLSLRFDAFVDAIGSFKIHIFIQIFTFVIIPLCIQVLNALLWMLFGVNEWILKGCMPPPVSSAIIITKSIGGNEAVAVFNSIVGSFLGILITPFVLLFFLGSTAMVSMVNSVVILSQTVLIPLIIGMILKSYNVVRNIHVYPLTTVGQFLLLFIIYTTFCDALITHDTPMGASDILVTIVLVVLIQLAFLFISFRTSQYFNIYTPSDIVAITFCSTHKSLTLGIPILRILFSGYSHFTQITFPLLVYHPIQIILGTLLLAPFKKWMTLNKSKLKVLP